MTERHKIEKVKPELIKCDDCSAYLMLDYRKCQNCGNVFSDTITKWWQSITKKEKPTVV